MHIFLHFGTYSLEVLQLILASKLSELEQFENLAANGLFMYKIENFLANGCVLGQNARKETPFKIQFYCQDNINLLSAPFLKLINGICLFFCLLAGNLQPNFQIALTYSILKLKSILIPPDKMT
jgi:hypothetical protein